MTMPTAKKVIDIDSMLKEHREKVQSERKYIPVKLFDREWRIVNQINNFTALRAGEGDVEAFTQFLLNCTHDDEKADFRNALYSSDMMDSEGLLMIINHLMEAVANHPTKSSSGSSRSARTQVAKPKSAAT
jgi:hypothetical protein